MTSMVQIARSLVGQVGRTALEASGLGAGGLGAALLCACATSRALVQLLGVGPVVHRESVRRLEVGSGSAFMYDNSQDPRLFAGALPKLEGPIT